MEDNLNLEYLPDDPNQHELKNKEKTEKKLKEFREYIVNKGIVLAFTKVLLSLKYSDTFDKNPNRKIRKFFSEYSDPNLEESRALLEKSDILFETNKTLFQEVQDLELEVEKAKRKWTAKQIYDCYETDPKTGLVTTKNIVEKLSGNKKFEVDDKYTFEDFYSIIEKICEGDTNLMDVLLNNFEKSTQGVIIYKDDLDNPVYKKIIQIIKENKQVQKK